MRRQVSPMRATWLGWALRPPVAAATPERSAGLPRCRTLEGTSQIPVVAGAGRMRGAVPEAVPEALGEHSAS